MKMIYRVAMIIMTVVTFIPLSSLIVEGNEVGFSIEPILPSNQLDKDSGYYHLELAPEEQQTVTVLLKNNTDQIVTLKTKVASATTNINGVVDYDQTENQPNSDIPIRLEELVELPRDILLEPQTEMKLPITLSMTDKKLNGLIAGGISFEEVKEEKTSTLTNQASISNEFVYVVAVLLQQQAQLSEKTELNLTGVYPKQLNTKNSITADIKNETSTFLNDVNVEATVYKKGSREPLYHLKKEDAQIAPNSTFSIPMFLNGDKLKAGEYTYATSIRGVTQPSTDSPKESLSWKFEKDFKIESRVAKKLNATDTTLATSSPSSVWLYIMIGINIVLIGSIGGYFIYRRSTLKK